MKTGIICALFFFVGCSNSFVVYSNTVQSAHKGFLVVGDTQRTLRIEMILFFREQNDAERQKVVDAIAGESADFLVMVGDLVGDGSSSFEWSRFDGLMTNIRNANLPILPAMGNHDYWGDSRISRNHIEERFPQLATKHWYTQSYDGVGLLFLDSNVSEMSTNDWNAEKAWYKTQIQTWDSDPTIKGTITFAHHPPYTNSTVTGDEIDVQNAFNDAFKSSTKSLAFITGHAHAYEHFSIDGKSYIVSGGGGGPRVTLLSGTSARHADLYTGPSPRPFNYLKLLPSSSGVHVTVKGLDKGANDFRTLEEFDLNFP